MSSQYYPPEYEKSAFHCPICGVYANQYWGQLLTRYYGTLAKFSTSKCSHCESFSIWYDKKLVFPDQSIAPSPNPDMPEEIVQDYNEASSILNRSPRAAAAMYRLCLQKLMPYIGGEGKHINEDIKKLIADGELPHSILKSLDIVRIVGNESAHPGTIDLNDQPQIALQLAKLINFIIQSTITQKREIDELYAMTPEQKRNELGE